MVKVAEACLHKIVGFHVELAQERLHQFTSKTEPPSHRGLARDVLVEIADRFFC